MKIDADKINPDLLPRLLRELAAVIGLSAALKLAEAYPGVALYIPGNPTPEHDIAKAIGFDALQKLAAHYGQEHLRLPKLDAALRQIKHQLVYYLKAQGASNREVALEVGYTTRRIEQLTAANAETRQNDLFSEEVTCKPRNHF